MCFFYRLGMSLFYISLSQGYFPRWQLPKCTKFQAATPQVCRCLIAQPPAMRLGPLAAALGPLAHPSRSTWPTSPS